MTQAMMVHGPNDFHVEDGERGTLGPGLNERPPVGAMAIKPEHARPSGLASGETPDVKELKARAKTLSAAEKELDRERQKFEAEKAAWLKAQEGK